MSNQIRYKIDKRLNFIKRRPDCFKEKNQSAQSIPYTFSRSMLFVCINVFSLLWNDLHLYCAFHPEGIQQ